MSEVPEWSLFETPESSSFNVFRTGPRGGSRLKFDIYMGAKRPFFSADAWIHVYKRRADGYLLFYSVRDFLVYYTIFSVMARRHGVKVHALCLMFDHVHELIQCDNLKQFRSFERDVDSLFALEYNRFYGRQGRLFDDLGYSTKKSVKEKRTTFAYVCNNPVERRITSRAVEYKWNFLSMAKLKTPHIPDYAHSKIKFAARWVDYLHANNRPVTYQVLENMVKHLSNKETDVIINYIRHKYLAIDYIPAISLYGDWNTAMTAINANSGADYEINERFIGRSDADYIRIINLLISYFQLSSAKDIPALPPDLKLQAFNLIQTKTSLKTRQISMILQIPARDKENVFE